MPPTRFCVPGPPGAMLALNATLDRMRLGGADTAHRGGQRRHYHAVPLGRCPGGGALFRHAAARCADHRSEFCPGLPCTARFKGLGSEQSDTCRADSGSIRVPHHRALAATVVLQSGNGCDIGEREPGPGGRRSDSGLRRWQSVTDFVRAGLPGQSTRPRSAYRQRYRAYGRRPDGVHSRTSRVRGSTAVVAVPDFARARALTRRGTLRTRRGLAPRRDSEPSRSLDAVHDGD